MWNGDSFEKREQTLHEVVLGFTRRADIYSSLRREQESELHKVTSGCKIVFEEDLFVRIWDDDT